MAQKTNLLITMVIIVGLAWWQEDKLKQQWHKLYPTSAPVATQTTVYTWKDKDGTIHYSNTPDHQQATATMVDTNKINRLEPLPVKEQPKQDKLLIMEMREELARNRDKMQAAREQQMMNDIHQ